MTTALMKQPTQPAPPAQEPEAFYNCKTRLPMVYEDLLKKEQARRRLVDGQKITLVDLATELLMSSIDNLPSAQ